MVLVCMLPMVWMGVRAGFCDFLEVEVGVEGVLTPSPGTRGGASPQGAISKHQQAAACRSGQKLGLLVGVWAACRSGHFPPFRPTLYGICGCNEGVFCLLHSSNRTVSVSA